MATNGFFGGLLGKAESDLKGRKSKLDQAEEDATKGSSTPPPQKDTPKEDKPAPRPPMSKKWYE